MLDIARRARRLRGPDRGDLDRDGRRRPPVDLAGPARRRRPVAGDPRGPALPQGRPDRLLPGRVPAAGRRGWLRRGPGRRAGHRVLGGHRHTTSTRPRSSPTWPRSSPGWPTSPGRPAPSACTARPTRASTPCSWRPVAPRLSRRSVPSTPPTTASPTTSTTWAASSGPLDLVDYPTYMIACNALPPVPGGVRRGLARGVAAAARPDRALGAAVADRAGGLALLAQGLAAGGHPAARVRRGLRPHRGGHHDRGRAGPTATATTPSGPSSA